MALVDLASIDPRLEKILGPLPTYTGTPHDVILRNSANYVRDLFNAEPAHMVGGFGQYGCQNLYREFYRGGDASLRTTARAIVEMIRDGVFHDPVQLQAYMDDPNAGVFIQGFNNLAPWMFAVYAIENPAGEAAAVRKCRDIVRLYGAVYWKFYRPYDVVPGSGYFINTREGSATWMWILCSQMMGDGNVTCSFEFGTRLRTVNQMAADIETAFLNNMPRPYVNFPQGEEAAPYGRYQAAHKVGLFTEVVTLLDRFKGSGTDTRILPALLDEINLYLNPQRHTASMVDSGEGGIIGGHGHHYYYYNNDNFQPQNGVGAGPYAPHTGPHVQQPLGGHQLQGYAHAYARTGNVAHKTEMQSLINDGLIPFFTNMGGVGLFSNPRVWTEFSRTWYTALGMIEEYEGGVIEPPERDMQVTPLNPAVGATITVTITNGPGNQADWVAIAPAGSALTVFNDWKYLANNSQGFPSSGVINGTVTLTANGPAGAYEVRFLANDEFVLVPGVDPVAITVGPGVGFQGVLTVNGDPSALYSVVLTTSPPEEYDVRWLVDGAPYPGAVPGPLVKPASKRYFADGAGRAVYLTGSHNWNNITSWGNPPTTPGNPPSAFDFNAHLQRLLAEGHTATRFWCLGDFVHSGTTFRKVFPWARTGTPGASDGGNKWNLTQFDQAYFDGLRSRVQQAHEAGLTCIVMVFNAWDNWNNTGTNIWHAAENSTVDGDVNHDGLTKEATELAVIPATLLNVEKALVHKIVDTLNDLDHLIWEVVNEPGPTAHAWVQDMIADLRAYESSKPKQHAIMQGFYGQTGGSTNTQLWSLNVEAVAPSTLELGGASPDGSGNYLNDPPAAAGTKVIVADTDHIVGVGLDSDWVWKAFCRGLNPIYMDPMTDTEAFNPANPPAPQYQRARDAMGLTAQLARRFRSDLNTLTPQGQGTATPANTGYSLSLGGDAGEYLVYRPAGGPNPVTGDLTPVNPAIDIGFVWIHPLTGAMVATGDVAGGAIRTFTPPSGSDWVLFIRRLDLPYSLFGMTGTTPNTGNLGPGTKLVQADVYSVTGTLLGQPQIAITNNALNGTITWPTVGWVFSINNPVNPDTDFAVLEPGSPGILGVQFRLRPVAGGSAVNVGAEVTVPEANGTFRLDPLVHTAFTDGDYMLDAVMRSATQTATALGIAVTINNGGNPPLGKRQGRRLRGRLP